MLRLVDCSKTPVQSCTIYHSSRSRTYGNQVLRSDSAMEQIDGTMEVQSIYGICQKSARHDTGILFRSRNPRNSPECISYREFWERANQDVAKIDNIPGIKPQTIILLHFDRHQDSIRWFWAVVAAGYIPAISPPLPSEAKQRKEHLIHVFNVLTIPVLLTTEALRRDFQSQKNLLVFTPEYLQLPRGTKSQNTTSESAHLSPGGLKKEDELAVLMLTSGSSGNAKAVCLP